MIPKKNDSKKKKKKTVRVWDWITTILLLLGLFCGILLIYQWRSREQKLARLRSQLAQKEQEIQQQYQLQDIYLISTADLANSSAIHSFFTDLLTTYVEKFARSKKIDICFAESWHLSARPLIFKGFYWDKNIGNSRGEMGRCSSYSHPRREVEISLNRLYLLNKLGHDKYFTSNPNQGDYTYIDISFAKMIETCSHELAHYFQFVKHNKSSCESDLILKNGKYSEELAKEHEEWTGEIYRLIKTSPEYGEWERRWKGIE